MRFFETSLLLLLVTNALCLAENMRASLSVEYHRDNHSVLSFEVPAIYQPNATSPRCHMVRTLECASIQVHHQAPDGAGTVQLPGSPAANEIRVLKDETSEFIDKMWFTNATLHPVPTISSSIMIGSQMLEFDCPIPAAHQIYGYIVLRGFTFRVNCSLSGLDGLGNASLILSFLNVTSWAA